MLTSSSAKAAFDLSKETDKLRDQGLRIDLWT